jgi:hypothetical protein
VILSPASVNSGYVNYEWAFALGCGIPVLPVLLEAVEYPIQSRLEGLPIIDFTQQSSPRASASLSNT